MYWAQGFILMFTALASRSMILAWLLRRREEDYFPCLFPWVVFVVTLAIRVHYVNQPHNWWVVHPDEIFQSLEGVFRDVCR